MEFYSSARTSMSTFKPYELNGGSIVAIAGDDYAMIASDTRLNKQFAILSRDQSKLFDMTSRAVLGAAGCWCDVLGLTAVLRARVQIYELEQDRPLATRSLAQMLAVMLYNRRFFPYYVSLALAGLDADGRGCVFAYDPIGHYEQCKFLAAGTAEPMLQPFLDNQLGGQNLADGRPRPISKEKALCVVRDVFTAAAERDVQTGDALCVNILTRRGVVEKRYPLRRD